jgi:hypothetical protein
MRRLNRDRPLSSNSVSLDEFITPANRPALNQQAVAPASPRNPDNSQLSVIQEEGEFLTQTTSFVDHSPKTIMQHPIHYGPVHATACWKSDAKKMEDQFDKIRKGVKIIAPELFKDKPKPFKIPAHIFPRTFKEYKEFRNDMYVMRADELEDNAGKLSRIAESMENIPKNKRQIKSAFGEQGKMFLDGFGGPVLMQPTIWSIEHDKLATCRAPWPTRAELLCNGDNRENDGYTRCGRYLPVPRQPREEGVSIMETPFIEPYAMDMTGPLRCDGPGPAEVAYANEIMDNDEAFEAELGSLLGNDLMLEVGTWDPPYLPFEQGPRGAEGKKGRVRPHRRGDRTGYQAVDANNFHPANNGFYLGPGNHFDPSNVGYYSPNGGAQYASNAVSPYPPGNFTPDGAPQMQYHNMQQVPVGQDQQGHTHDTVSPSSNNTAIHTPQVSAVQQVPAQAHMLYQQADGSWVPYHVGTLSAGDCEHAYIPPPYTFSEYQKLSLAMAFRHI